MTRAGRVAMLAVLACVGAACSKSEEAPPPPMGSDRPPEVVPAAEVQRGKDACQGYVDRACACAKTVPAAKEACDLSRGGPAAITTALEVSQSPDSTRKDAIDAQHMIRKIVKSCIEETARLPLLGCPP